MPTLAAFQGSELFLHFLHTPHRGPCPPRCTPTASCCWPRACQTSRSVGCGPGGTPTHPPQMYWALGPLAGLFVCNLWTIFCQSLGLVNPPPSSLCAGGAAAGHFSHILPIITYKIRLILVKCRESAPPWCAGGAAAGAGHCGGHEPPACMRRVPRRVSAPCCLMPPHAAPCCPHQLPALSHLLLPPPRAQLEE